MDFDRYDRIRPIRWEGDHLVLLDQRRLPFEVAEVACRDSDLQRATGGRVRSRSLPWP